MNGYYILYNIYAVINTLLYFWLGNCLASIGTFISGDEKAVAFMALPVFGLIMDWHI
jgi:hypothetical protein